MLRPWPDSSDTIDLMDFSDDAVLHYAEIGADLKKRGALIGANDLFIAAHGRAHALTLVTNTEDSNASAASRSITGRDRRAGGNRSESR
jgi:predicted nucleic acid-binding protein